MKIFTKSILALVGAVAIASTAFAGGPMTNTNQSASFLRSIARGTTLDSDAVYFNPAGTAFMENGWHLGISDQFAWQSRSTLSTLSMGTPTQPLPGGFSNKEFKGEVFSPVIPALHLTWKHNRWAVMFGLGVNGGGGTIKYDNGLASFERIVSSIPAAVAGATQGTVVPTAYSRDLALEGSSMTLAFNLGASFRVTDWLAVAAQVRVASTSNSYSAHLRDMMLTVGGQPMPASAILAGTPYASLVQQELDVKQKGLSVSPILAVSFQKNGWAASVKYEFKMATELENETSKDINLGSGGMFPDGAKVENETPALLAVSASREIGPVKVTLGWHHYFDKAAKNSFTKNNAQGIYNNQYCVVKGNTNEFLLGAEWQISDRWLVSAGTQRTQFNFNEQYYSDMNFTNSSWSVGLGLAFKASETIRINAGYMKTFYDEVEVSGIHSFGGQQLGAYTDLYKRTSDAFGIGLDFKFGK